MNEIFPKYILVHRSSVVDSDIGYKLKTNANFIRMTDTTENVRVPIFSTEIVAKIYLVDKKRSEEVVIFPIPTKLELASLLTNLVGLVEEIVFDPRFPYPQTLIPIEDAIKWARGA